MERTVLNGISFFGPGSVFQGVVTTLNTWQDRARERQHLASLEPHMMKDIGIERSDLRREVGKPFWQA